MLRGGALAAATVLQLRRLQLYAGGGPDRHPRALLLLVRCAPDKWQRSMRIAEACISFVLALQAVIAAVDELITSCSG